MNKQEYFSEKDLEEYLRAKHQLNLPIKENLEKARKFAKRLNRIIELICMSVLIFGTVTVVMVFVWIYKCWSDIDLRVSDTNNIVENIIQI